MSDIDLDELLLEATEYPGWSSWCGDIIERLAAALAEALAQNAAHDTKIRIAALEEAGRDLLRGIGIQSTNGIGWMPTDSLRGAGRYLLHISHAAKEDKP